MKRLFLFVIFIMGSLLIFGCSGGLDEVSVDDKVIHLRLVNDAEEDIDRIKAGSPAHLVAILENTTGKPLGGKAITFNTTLGYIQPATGIAVTDDDGQTQVLLLAGTEPGTGEITATYGQYSSAFSFVTDGDMNMNMTLRLFNDRTGAETNVVSADWPGRLEAVLNYGDENPLPRQIISFSTTLGEIQPFIATAATDENGRAGVLLSAGSVPGDGEVIATFDKFSTALSFVTYAEQDVHISVQLLNNESKLPTNLISATSPGRLEAMISYTNGTPLPNRLIRFNTTMGELQPSDGVALTDAEGKAYVTLLAGSDPGDGKAAAVFGKYDEYSTSLGFVTSGDQDVRLSLRLSDHEGKEIQKISTDSPGYLEALFSAADGTPISGQKVSFSATLGEIRPETGTAQTNSEGRATVLLLAGSAPGVGDASATSGGNSADTSFMSSGDQDVSISLKLTDDQQKTISKIGPDTTGHLTATLLHTSGTPMISKIVDFSATLGEIHPAGKTALTDSEGKADVLLLAGSAAGVGDASATFNGHSDTLSFVAEADEPDDMILSVRLTDEKGEPMNTIRKDLPGHLTAELTYASGNPGVSQVVQFATTVGTLHPSDGKALTDKEGKAGILLLAGSAAGVGDATAASNGHSDTVSFVAEVDEPDDIILTVRLTDEKGEPIDTIREDQPGHLEAVLTYAGGAPAVSQMVRFDTTLGRIYPTEGTDLTDAEGKAAVLLLADSKKGVGDATATNGSHSDTLSFTVDVNEPDDIHISLKLTDDKGEDVSLLTAEQPGHLTAMLTYADGAPAVGEIVYFNTTLGSIYPENRIAVTDSKGMATMLLLAGSSEGVGNASAIFGNFSGTVNFVTEVDEPDDILISLKLTDAEGKEMTSIRADQPGYLEAALTYKSGQPVISQTVHFQTTLGSVRPDAETTDIQGRAKVLLLAGSVAGVGDATATFNTLSSTASFKVEVEKPEEIILSLRLTDDTGKTISQISSGAPGHLTATLTYAGGDPVPNSNIYFQTQTGNIYPEAGTAVTDKDGQATVLLLGGDVEGPGEATAIFGSHVASTSFVTTVESPEEMSLSLELLDDKGDTISKLSAGASAHLVATLKYESGNPVPNKTIRFYTTSGRIYSDNSEAMTNTDGKADVLLIAGSSGGVAQTTATFGGYSDALSFMVETEPAKPILSLRLLNPATGYGTSVISADSPGRLEATLTDTDGAYIYDEVITFTTTLGNIVPSAGAALTDTYGQARVDILAGSVPGSGVATAIFGEYSDSADFVTSGNQRDEMNLSVRLEEKASNELTNRISADTPGRLEVVLTDADGKPVPNKVVSFNTTLGKFYPPNGTALTDSNGLASVLLFAGSEPGAGEAGAVHGEYVSDTLNFVTFGDQPEDKKISLRLLDNASGKTSATVGAKSPGRLEAILTDADGTPLSGQMVIFSTTLGELYPPDGTALTNSDGLATIILLSVPEAGDAEAAATFGDYSVMLNFVCAGDQLEDVSLSFRLLDNTTGYETDVINSESPGRLEATLSDADGMPLSTQLIRFSFSTDFGMLYPTDGTDLTNSRGLATVLLLSGSDAGSGTATATFGKFSGSLNITNLGDENIRPDFSGQP